MDDYRLYHFQRISTRSQETVFALLRCAIEDPEGHFVLTGSSGVKSKPVSYRVVRSGNRPPSDAVNEDWDLGHFLIEFGLAVIPDDGDWNKFRFAPETIAWYRQTHPPTDTEVREAVGRYFHEMGTGDPALSPVDTPQVAETLALPPARVRAAIRALEGAGLLKTAGGDGSGAPNLYQLTERGFQWAMTDFLADVALSPSVTLTVNVTLEIQQVIDVIASLPLPEDEKDAHKNTAHRLERELRQSEPAWDVIKDALQMAADVKEVAVPILTILANHRDQVGRAIEQLPFP